jgi:hypothetical protein
MQNHRSAKVGLMNVMPEDTMTQYPYIPVQ